MQLADTIEKMTGERQRRCRSEISIGGLEPRSSAQSRRPPQLRLDFSPQRRRQLAGPTPYRVTCLSLRFSLLEPIAALTPIAAHLLAHRAPTDYDAQNAAILSWAGPALTQRINLTAILVRCSPVLPHRQPLAISRGYPLSHHSIMRWIVESAKL
jgi:hypothetical protein